MQQVPGRGLGGRLGTVRSGSMAGQQALHLFRRWKAMVPAGCPQPTPAWACQVQTQWSQGRGPESLPEHSGPDWEHYGHYAGMKGGRGRGEKALAGGSWMSCSWVASPVPHSHVGYHGKPQWQPPTSCLCGPLAGGPHQETCCVYFILKKFPFSFHGLYLWSYCLWAASSRTPSCSVTESTLG
ncbi:hypothetical protein HJG60_010614 [Phyllostomus discolor]|uniref:Uncharacterized protein n=1 Tax=Phyllostomus discolor TaxID=89673 RepID=A0A834APP0_9CHIR|nr:hypothetical protein HJG60_010614 [Phyllostomus discolor]